MHLEEAISNIENVSTYKKIGFEGLSYWNKRIRSMPDFGNNEKRQLQERVDIALEQHHEVYRIISDLNRFAKSKLPNPKDYGKNATELLILERLEPYSYGATIIGLLSAAGIFINTGPLPNSIGMLPSITTMAFGYVSKFYGSYRIPKLLKREDASDYMRDMGDYYFAKKVLFSEKRVPNMETIMDNYSVSIQKLLVDFEKYDAANLADTYLVDTYIAMKTFRSSFKETIQAVQMNKKLSLPSWNRGVSNALARAGILHACGRINYLQNKKSAVYMNRI